MNFSKLMGEVINLPTRTNFPSWSAADRPDPSGDDRPRPRRRPLVPVPLDEPDDAPKTPSERPDEDDVLEGTVLVDQPDRRPSSLRTKLSEKAAAQRRPIIAPWLSDPAEAEALIRWSVNYAAHVTGYHVVRVPLYAATLAARSPRGLWRVVSGTWRWVNDVEALPLRLHAVDAKDADTYLRLLRERDDRVRWRRLVALSGLCGASIAAGAVAAAGGVTQVTVIAALVAVLGWLGTPKDKPLVGPAVVSTKAPKLTSEIVIRALGSLGIAEINKALGKSGDGITFPAPITRDGPGWRADVDLPYGVTVTDIMDRRERLASGLRRPVGCVWPEPAHDQHAGRLVLWVGDQDMSQVKPAAWPLAKSGKADVFKPIPFGTDQRGRLVTATLMFANWLIGAMPRMGKTFAIKPLLLAAGLDVTVENLVYELKGTGDLSFAEKFAHRYASGVDDATIAACLDGLRYVYKDLERRAKALSSLPKDICPENKVTPEIAARRSLGLHPLGLFIDECQELFSHPEFGKEAAELATAIIKRGPAMGVFLVLATQRPDKDSLPTGVSANVGIRFCLRVMGQVENDMVLGTSAYRNGIRATTFTRRDLGIGYLVGEADDPQITRSFYIDGPTGERIADRARAARKAAGRLAGYAAGEEVAPSDDTQVSVLDDVAAVIGVDEEKIWSETIIARLAELRPALYAGWTPAQLADALKPYGIATRQVWGQTASGKGRNLKGIHRKDVLAALDARRLSGS